MSFYTSHVTVDDLGMQDSWIFCFPITGRLKRQHLVEEISQPVPAITPG